jgi:hypothetical protein
MNVSIFKMFVEGVIKGKLLYKNGIHTFQHNGLPVFTANTLPNIKMDTGVLRRIQNRIASIDDNIRANRCGYRNRTKTCIEVKYRVRGQVDETTVV